MKTLTIKDESVSGKILNEIALKFSSEYITVKELIAARIKEEVSLYESKNASVGSGLVTPTNIEQRLNQKKVPKIDVEKQIYVALDAFENNGFFILIDNEQVEKLDEKFLIDGTSNVSFIKLTPLVGG